MKKVIVYILTITMLVANMGVVFAGTEEPPEEFINYLPDIILDGSSNISNAKSGATYTITLNLKNIGNAFAKTIVVNSDSGESPLRAEVQNSNIIDNLNANKTQQMSFIVSVSETATRGKYPIVFHLEVKTNNNNIIKKDITTYVQVTSEKIKPILVIKDLVQTPEKVNAGDPFKVSFNVINNGELPAKEVKMYLDGFKTDGFMPVDMTPYQYASEILPGGEQAFTYSITTAKKIKDGMNEIKIKADYNDGTEKKYSDENLLYINVKGDKTTEGDEKSKPKVIISDYRTSGGLVAGGDFYFKFTAANTSKTASIRNVKMSVSSADGTFVIKEGSGSFWIEEIPAKGTITKDVVFNIKADSLSKSSPIDIKFDYEYGEGLEGASAETVSLAISEQTKLLINDVSATDGMMVDQIGNVSFEIINMGKATLNNVSAVLESETLKPTSKMTYVGNFITGKSESFDIEVKPLKEGECNGTLTITYEDSNGNKMSQKREVTATVMPMYVEPAMPLPEDPALLEPKPLVKPVIFAVAEVILFIVVILISRKIYLVCYRKKHHLNEEM